VAFGCFFFFLFCLFVNLYFCCWYLVSSRTISVFFIENGCNCLWLWCSLVLSDQEHQDSTVDHFWRESKMNAGVINACLPIHVCRLFYQTGDHILFFPFITSGNTTVCTQSECLWCRFWTECWNKIICCYKYAALCYLLIFLFVCP